MVPTDATPCLKPAIMPYLPRNRNQLNIFALIPANSLPSEAFTSRSSVAVDSTQQPGPKLAWRQGRFRLMQDRGLTTWPTTTHVPGTELFKAIPLESSTVFG